MSTEIIIILDRSGSMASIHSDMEGGLNTFIEEQAKDTVDAAFITLVQFDTYYERLFEHTPITEVGTVKLVPRGGTALLDAVGKTLADVEKKTDNVVVLVVTDGYENASREWRKQTVKELVEKRTSEGWQFVYLGAGIDAFADSGDLGFQRGQTVSTGVSGQSLAAMYATVGRKTASFRSGQTQSFEDFSQEEREQMSDHPDTNQKEAEK